MRTVEKELPQEFNQISHQIIGAAIEVHRHLGPGLLEAIYERALIHELTLQGVKVQSQVPVKVHYKGIEIGIQRMDLLVDSRVVVEIKAVDCLNDIHKAQLISYLKCTGLPLGLLINFNVEVLKSGVKRIVLSS